MSEEEVVRHCAPTLAGLKTANMFRAAYSKISEINSDIRKMNRSLKEKGIRVMPLSYEDGHALIYIYRPVSLRRDLSDRLACEVLSSYGYCVEKPEQCIARLVKKLQKSNIFPHEIGFFLGYPAEDVIGFINDRDKCKACTKKFCSMYKNGISMEKLAVAI